ncbi:hypothetical protein L1049_006406 [Liquidambar formosana]|uniref:Pectinesterase inhibitor domain-containing protein n=1 Tax=Liquidambar formosana TaxID=63359 RepID=A0AAP0RFV7_LIQFO
MKSQSITIRNTMKSQRPLFLLSLYSSALLFLLQPITAVGYLTPTANDTDFIRTSCGATLYPELCYNSLAGYAYAVQQDPAQLARVAIRVSLSKTRHMASYVSNLSRQADYGAPPRVVAALHDCFTNFDDAVDQIRGSLKEMRRLGSGESLRFQMSNVQTWMSAALTDVDTCTDGFEDAPDGQVKTDVCERVTKVREFTSNALALINSYASKETP